MRRGYDHDLAMETAADAGRSFFDLAPAILDRVLKSPSDRVSSALAVIVADQADAVREAVRRAGASDVEARMVSTAYLMAANAAGADRRRRATN